MIMAVMLTAMRCAAHGRWRRRMADIPELRMCTVREHARIPVARDPSDIPQLYYAPAGATLPIEPLTHSPHSAHAPTVCDPRGVVHVVHVRALAAYPRHTLSLEPPVPLQQGANDDAMGGATPLLKGEKVDAGGGAAPLLKGANEDTEGGTPFPNGANEDIGGACCCCCCCCCRSCCSCVCCCWYCWYCWYCCCCWYCGSD